MLGRGAGDIVSHEQYARVDAAGSQSLRRQAEIQHIARIIAEAEDHAAAVIGSPGHANSGSGGWGSKHIASHGSIGKARTDIARKGRIMARTTTDHDRHLALRHGRRPDHAIPDQPHAVGIQSSKAGKCRCREILRRVIDPSHAFLPHVCRSFLACAFANSSAEPAAISSPQHRWRAAGRRGHRACATRRAAHQR
jgi:hypothetical protein